MSDTITIAEVKEKVAVAEQEIAVILNKLQEDTTINVKALMLTTGQLEVARNDDMKLKIEYDL
jgi:hypothetical protein